MNNPPPRKRFQIHLSTAIVMMFVAGALIWANMKNEFSVAHYGWPVPAIYSAGFNGITINYRYIAIDIVIAFNILYITRHFCEWVIRRRSARKGA